MAGDDDSALHGESCADGPELTAAEVIGELPDLESLLAEAEAHSAAAKSGPVRAPESARPAVETPASVGPAEAETPPPAESDEGEFGRRRRRRDPFAGMEFSSTQAALRSRELTSLAELKRIKSARVRHEGKRVVTDDVKKLKSLSIEPRLPPGEYINYYVEPVRIEYYIPRESRFAVETRYLYIPLVDPSPREQDIVLREHMEQNRFVDIVDLMNERPIYITDILESYNSTMRLYESMSRAIQEADQGKDESYRTAYYLVETLMDYEPSMAALSFLGDFLGWDLNWLIRAMNALGVEFAASDRTIAYLIKKRNIYWEEQGLPYDERFEILAALFYEQAFPNRGLNIQEEDYFYDIFDRKFKM